ncbi:MAG: transcription-repair coupling factor [Christensenellales bacterium]
MNRIIGYIGASDSSVAPLIAQAIKKDKLKGPILLIVSSQNRAMALLSDISFFCDKPVFVMPPRENLFMSYTAKSRENTLKRIEILKSMEAGEDIIVIAATPALMRKLPPVGIYNQNKIKLRLSDIIKPEELKKNIVKLGYEPMSMVESIGEFSSRGGIFDFYSPSQRHPVRIEFFGDEIDSIRTFDIETQRSVQSIDEITIYPARDIYLDREQFDKVASRIIKDYNERIEELMQFPNDNSEAIDNLLRRKEEVSDHIKTLASMSLMENYIQYFYDNTSFLWDYVNPKSGTILIEEPDKVEEYIEAQDKENKREFDSYYRTGRAVMSEAGLLVGLDDFLNIYSDDRVDRGYSGDRGHQIDTLGIIMPFAKKIDQIKEYTKIEDVKVRLTENYGGRMDRFAAGVTKYLGSGYRVSIVIGDETKLNSIKEFLKENNIPDQNIEFLIGNISRGSEFYEEKLVYISEFDIFGKTKTVKRRRASSKEKAVFFSELKPGDYIVHENHGIGLFKGMEQVVVEGEKKDYLLIQYAGTDRLFVPVDQMGFLQKYVGAEGIKPKINKLSGGDWKATKAKAKLAIAEMTGQLLELYAKRQGRKGYAFGPDSPWQRDFEDSFPFAETEDQLVATEEIKGDMEKDFAMDRLLCGDVGFGKTEVAARAIFKCISDGKQAVVLVPTTILAIQHYHTLRERFEKFPMKVAVISRFQSKKEQSEILKNMSKGQIDLLIGTHRLLSDDVKFKDLGLLVVDEEQRFGVAHKERIKELKVNVDVLTLSATPIPRTLNMSLSGIKEMSLISQPPQDRMPVQTYVVEEDDFLIKDIIHRELARGGQVFVVYNRVKGILSLAERIRKIVPDAKVVIAHGQMREHALEDVMMNFVAGEADVMVCTTIIETGIDIPNANSLIILNADKLGLSQLYQLRGRVGRSTRTAYAYLMYRRGKSLSEAASKRLKAIKDFTEFGSGFKIAMRDLEIRGAGNLLGSQQSGHMMNIGYELYCRLVDDAVRALKGEVVREKSEDLKIDLNVSAIIPSWYIAEEELKMEMYKKCATISNDEDLSDIMDEFIDRFGDVPKETENIMYLNYIRSLAEAIGTSRIYEERGTIVVVLEKDNLLKAENLAMASAKFGYDLIINVGTQPRLRLKAIKKDKLEKLLSLMKLLKPGSDIPKVEREQVN